MASPNEKYPEVSTLDSEAKAVEQDGGGGGGGRKGQNPSCLVSRLTNARAADDPTSKLIHSLVKNTHYGFPNLSWH